MYSAGMVCLYADFVHSIYLLYILRYLDLVLCGYRGLPMGGGNHRLTEALSNGTFTAYLGSTV